MTRQHKETGQLRFGNDQRGGVHQWMTLEILALPDVCIHPQLNPVFGVICQTHHGHRAASHAEQTHQVFLRAKADVHDSQPERISAPFCHTGKDSSCRRLVSPDDAAPPLHR